MLLPVIERLYPRCRIDTLIFWSTYIAFAKVVGKD